MVNSSEPTASDYDATYLLPDHWIMHDRDPDGMFSRMHAYYAGRVIDILKSRGAKSVLEVGCGDGWISGQMANAGLDVVGIDWSSNAIQFATMRARNARFYVGDVRD